MVARCKEFQCLRVYDNSGTNEKDSQQHCVFLNDTESRNYDKSIMIQ